MEVEVSGSSLSPAAGAPPRSPVPDLLFEEEQEARLQSIRPFLDRPDAIAAETPLHRITVFLTYRCNLRCVFCKTLDSRGAAPAPDFDPDSFARLLDSHAGTPLHHLHMTGGEAGLVREMAGMVRLARERGAASVSTTSNGTLSTAVYLRWIEAGIDEIRLSLSASSPQLDRAVTGQWGPWDRKMQTVRTLTALRRDGTPFHLILNTLVSSANRARLPEIVRCLAGLGADDMKLITTVQERSTLRRFEEVDRVVQEIEAFLAALPSERFPLLRRKLRTVFAPDAIGLSDLPQKPDWRCYIPLTERTVDSRHYYPCSVYVREGGAPLGDITDPPDAQRAKSADFVRDARCLEDPICRNYCLNCTREFNIRANDARCG